MVKMFTISLAIILGLNCACMDNESTRYYKDIDLSRLKGIHEIYEGELMYPYIKIESFDKFKNVTFFFDRDNSMTFNYARQDSAWVASRKRELIDNMYYYFDIITDERLMVNFRYSGDPKDSASYLSSIQVLTDTLRTTYLFSIDDGIRSLPHFNMRNFPLEKARIKVSESFIRTSGKLMVSENRIFSKPKSELSTNSCYSFNDLSIYWFYQCYHFFNRIDC